MAIATDRLDMIEEVEYEVHYDESADDDWLDSLDNVKDDE